MRTSWYSCRNLQLLLPVALAAIIPLNFPVVATAEPDARPDAADVRAHWAARATLAHAVMFSGLGEPLSISMSIRDTILKHAGYVTRPRMPDMAMVGAVYAAANPTFKATPDFSDLQTLRWEPSSFDRTLDPAAQAWALIKITSPEFHLNFHDRKDDKRIALVMLPQARAQAFALKSRLLTDRGLFAALRADGTFAEPLARDQAVVLWGVSNLILAATSARDNYWHKAYRELVDAEDYRDLAARALDAIETLAPKTAADRALAIEALGRYALASTNKERQSKALTLSRGHAEALRRDEPKGFENAALAVYGLIEAGRLLRDDSFEAAAATLFRTRLLSAWDDQLGAFAADGAIAYTPASTASGVAALNAMRWHGPDDLAEQANAIYPKFLETMLVRAGLLLSSPLPLVPAAYRKDRQDADFAHPALPPPDKVNAAPVFGGEVRHENGRWHLSDRRFRTAEAMFLANMLVMPRDGASDAFLPAHRLSSLRD